MYRSLLLVPLLVVGLAGPASADPVDTLHEIIESNELSLAELPRVCVGQAEEPIVDYNWQTGMLEVNPNGDTGVRLSNGPCE